MDNYCVNRNAQENGDHEVHKMTCLYLPLAEHQLPLGYFNNCHEAVAAAKRYYSLADGCHYCCPECDKR
jgi:hypothetical protein